MTTTAPTYIGENNDILVSKLKSLAVPVETKPVAIGVDEASKKQQSGKEFIEQTLQKYNEQQQKEQQKIRSPKPSYKSVSEDDKITFLQELSQLFKAKSQAKKAMWENKFTLDEKGVINDYKILSQQLQKGIPLLRGNSMLRSSIAYDPNLFVVFTSTDKKRKRLTELTGKIREKTVTPVERREYGDIQKELQQINSLDSFTAIIDILKKKVDKLKSFIEFLKKISKTGVYYERLLFLIIMQGAPGEDTTIINDLKNALTGIYESSSSGGKRRTKKIKINKTKFHRKTRSIKRSKNNITRRR